MIARLQKKQSGYFYLEGEKKCLDRNVLVEAANLKRWMSLLLEWRTEGILQGANSVD